MAEKGALETNTTNKIRTTKRYVVTTSALNCYGFRVLTLGGDLSAYPNNPLMLWMHVRATGTRKDEVLALGSGVDLKIEGDALTCFLEFDTADTFAMQIYNKYENGTYNMLSLGALPLEASDDPALKLPGQTGLTITKWLLVEISCVDIGANPEANGSIQLYDADDNKLEMANLTGDSMITLFNSLQKTQTNDSSNMKLIQLTGPALSGILLALKLKDEASEVDVQKAVADMVQLSLSQATTIQTLTTAKETAEKELAQNLKLAGEQKVIALVDGAVAAKKILPAQKESYVKLANADFDSTKSILDALAPAKSISEVIEGGRAASTEVKLSWAELDKKGMLVKLKAENLEVFKQKFFEAFGKEYQD